MPRIATEGKSTDENLELKYLTLIKAMKKSTIAFIDEAREKVIVILK